MSDLKDVWDRVERRVTYGVLALFVALQLSAEIFPAVSQFMDARGSLLLLACSLLFLFRSVDQKISSIGVRDVTVSSSFVHGFVSMLQERKKHETIDIMTHTGAVYGRSLRESGCTVAQLRVLVMDCRIQNNMRYPSSGPERAELVAEFTRSMKELKMMLVEGRIGSLQVRAFPFEPMQHFALLDDNNAYFGFVIPQEGFPGVSSRRVPESFILNRSTPGGLTFTRHLATVFNDVWGNLAQEIDVDKF